MKGFFNRLLEIDLATEMFKYITISDDVLANTLGGKGLGTWLLIKENPVGVDPLSADNRLILATGAASGSKVWGQSRFGAFTKSPATGGYAESYCGGSMTSRIKGCGIDAVIIRGKSPSWRYLSINESGVEFHDAASIVGKDCYVSESAILKNESPNARAMVIGPAGENKVVFACVKAEKWRSLGRGGFGAVMGAKCLKGIVFDGKQPCELADPGALTQLMKSIAKQSKGSLIVDTYRRLGTPAQVQVANTLNFFPTRYWQSGHFEDWQTLSADYMEKNLTVKSNACPTCFLRCTKLSKVQKGRHKGLELEGPEFETIYALGGLNAIGELEEVAWLNDVCDRLGMDTMSAGNMTAFAIEAFKKGKSSFDIQYGQPDRVGELLTKIAFRKDVGDTLAGGIIHASRKWDMEDTAVHVKGLEPAGFDPRVLKGMGLSYATSARGACHLRGTFYKAELSNQIHPDTIEGKAELMIDYEDRAALFDTLILCRFFRDFIPWEHLETIIHGTTGIHLNQTQLRQIANRITEMTRYFNHREGIGKSHDCLPPYILNNKNEQGRSISPAELNTMISEYNTIRSNQAEQDPFLGDLFKNAPAGAPN